MEPSSAQPRNPNVTEVSSVMRPILSHGFSIGTAQKFAMAPTQGCRLSNGSIENSFNVRSSGAVVIAIGVVAVRVRASYQCQGGYAGGPGGT